jgi:hypothetical protein
VLRPVRLAVFQRLLACLHRQKATRVIEAALDKLGVVVTSAGETQIKGLCPVHHLVTGRADEHPSWYINSATGAWMCHSCKQHGSLTYLVQLMGGDPDIVGRIPIDYMKSKLEAIGQKEEEAAPYVPPVHVSEYALSKHPLLGKTHRAQRDLSLHAVESLGIRWNREKRCIILPVYHFDGHLMGWQEKSAGYFNNVPEGLPKRTSLFGYNVLMSGCPLLLESPLDVGRCLSYSMPAVAVYGSYTSPEQAAALSMAAKGVILAFDNDDAGWEGAVIASRMLKNLDVPVRYYNYPSGTEGLDPGELDADVLEAGYITATVLPPRAYHHAVERLSKRWRKRTKVKEENTLAELRSWAATVKRG